jgi:hypothetical protein
MVAKSSVLNDPFARQKCRSDTELQIRTASIVDRRVTEPRATRPRTERPELARTKLRTLKLLPSKKQSKHEILLPVCAPKPRTETELPRVT